MREAHITSAVIGVERPLDAVDDAIMGREHGLSPALPDVDPQCPD